MNTILQRSKHTRIFLLTILFVLSALGGAKIAQAEGSLSCETPSYANKLGWNVTENCKWIKDGGVAYSHVVNMNLPGNGGVFAPGASFSLTGSAQTTACANSAEIVVVTAVPNWDQNQTRTARMVHATGDSHKKYLFSPDIAIGSFTLPSAPGDYWVNVKVESYWDNDNNANNLRGRTNGFVKISANRLPSGYVDYPNANNVCPAFIGGWACDPDIPAQSTKVLVEVFRPNQQYSDAYWYLQSNQTSDYSNVCNGYAQRGFKVDVPSNLKDNVNRYVYVKAFDTTTGEQVSLPGSGSLLKCPFPVEIPPPPTINLACDQQGNTACTISHYETRNLYWTSTNATTCTINNVGGKPANGQQSTGPLLNTTTFTGTCTGPSGTSAPASVTYYVVPPPDASTFSKACSANGTSVDLTWRPASGYTTYYFRMNPSNADGSNNYNFPSAVIDDNVTSASGAATVKKTLTIVPGQRYTWWVHTKASNNAASQPIVGPSFACIPTTQPIISSVTASCAAPGAPSITVNWVDGSGGGTHNLDITKNSDFISGGWYKPFPGVNTATVSSTNASTFTARDGSSGTLTITPNTAYRFRMFQPVSSTGSWQASDEKTVTTPVCPVASCTGTLPGAASTYTMCPSDDTGLTGDTAKRLITSSSACTALKCEYACNANHTLTNGQCVPNPTSCPPGYTLTGGQCVQDPVISCPPNFTLVGGQCVNNTTGGSCPDVGKVFYKFPVAQSGVLCIAESATRTCDTNGNITNPQYRYASCTDANGVHEREI